MRRLHKAAFCPRAFQHLHRAGSWKRASFPQPPAPQSLSAPLCQVLGESGWAFVLLRSRHLRLSVGLGSKKEWRDPFIKCFLVFAATSALHGWHSSNICLMAFSESPLLKQAFHWHHRVVVGFFLWGVFYIYRTGTFSKAEVSLRRNFLLCTVFIF